ncbi:unnamed protein product [Prunus armeniaca]
MISWRINDGAVCYAGIVTFWAFIAFLESKMTSDGFVAFWRSVRNIFIFKTSYLGPDSGGDLRLKRGWADYGQILLIKFGLYFLVPAATSQSNQFKKYAMLNVAPIPLPTLGDSRSEISISYSPHWVRRQFGLDQGVPSSHNHADPFVLHRVFWSNNPIPNCCRPLVLASKRRIGGFSRGYQAYWNRCLASFREFQFFPGDRLPPTTARLAGLVLEEKAIPLFPRAVTSLENFRRQSQSREYGVLVVPKKVHHRVG